MRWTRILLRLAWVNLAFLIFEAVVNALGTVIHLPGTP